MSKQHPASFRDPDGFIFTKDEKVYRQINISGKNDFELLQSSGLYRLLSEEDLLLKHSEADLAPISPEGFLVLEPEQIPFISYPYEWCFSQFKDAALLTLQIQEIALQHGLSLKDATPFNVQFLKGKPVFIDISSFEKYNESEPWVAYKQFCEMFLLPLVLASYRDLRLQKLLPQYLDGIPLDLGAKLLPLSAKLKPSIFMHIVSHAKAQAKHASSIKKPQHKIKVSKHAQLALLDNLKSSINALKLQNTSSEWGNYYETDDYAKIAKESKVNFILESIKSLSPKSCWDLGSNTGEYSKLVSASKIQTIAFDIDPICVEKCYLECKKEANEYLLPLLQDFSNPSAAIGFGESERSSLSERGKVDLVMALALVHHLRITNNIPFDNLAKYISTLAQNLIIEFVPIDDSQAQRLLVSREGIFSDYSEESFVSSFQKFFTLKERKPIESTKRVMFLFSK